MIKGAIFDVDGTLLNSMYIWENIGEEYLRSLGIEPEKNLRAKIKALSLYQSACYFQNEYGVQLSTDEIMNGINKMIEDFYLNKAELKDGVADFLHELKNNGVKMCIATATDRYLVESALKRCKVLNYFSEIFTCTSVGHGKDEPIIYREATNHLNIDKKDVIIFEDALYAVKTAKADGFTVASIYDSSETNQDEIKSLSDFHFSDFSDTSSFWKFAL